MHVSAYEDVIRFPCVCDRVCVTTIHLCYIIQVDFIFCIFEEKNNLSFRRIVLCMWVCLCVFMCVHRLWVRVKARVNMDIVVWELSTLLF